MSLRINTSAVRAVLLADGWHVIVPGSFRLDVLEFSQHDPVVPAGSAEPNPIRSTGGDGFEFEEEDGMVAGPLSSVLAVSYAAPVKSLGSGFDQLAQLLQGEVVQAGGAQAVHFSYGNRQFEVWVDDSGQWAFSLLGHRSGDRELVSHTGLSAAEFRDLPSMVMGEIKGGFGRAQDRPESDPAEGESRSANKRLE
ncbi:hypothetical protein [Streptacidiphilus sp. MAP12-33]|uniref:hypothetical protein n=1 Tax=Streptacidiphilus sp. MAP12-33 TaxID=3156266 RepID=UPI003514BDB5